MALKVPEAIEALLAEADQSVSALDEDDLWSKVMAAAPDPAVCSPKERAGAFSEIAAWRFRRARGGESEPWGIYWAPLASGTLADGNTPFYSPDVAEIDEAILVHWIGRARSTKHPLL